MAATLSADERFDLITRRLQEHLGDDIIKAILAEDGRTPKCYWGPWSAGVGVCVSAGGWRTRRDRVHGPPCVWCAATRHGSADAARAAHIGYFVPLTKIADFLRAGVEVW
jgi:tyrosyl-tRNA synthetase